MKSLAMIIGGIFLLAAGQSPGGDDDVGKKDLKGFQGTWRVVSGEQNGKPNERLKGDKLTISSANFTVHREDKEVFKAIVKLDAGKKPKAIDVQIAEGEGKGLTALGIYALDGDNLKFCFDKPGNLTRPTEFTSMEGVERMVVALIREKK